MISEDQYDHKHSFKFLLEKGHSLIFQEKYLQYLAV